VKPFPTRRQEDWRYADLDALKPVWDDLSDPATMVVAAGESLEEIWLPSDQPVQLRRVQIALGEGASARIFALSTASEYGRVELEVTLDADASFELYAANIGDGTSTNETVTNVRHLGERGRSRQVVRSVLGGKATGSYLGKVEVARGAQKVDGEQSVKAMLLDRGECDLQLDPPIFARRAEREDARAGAYAEGDLDAAELHRLVAR
jgi:Fe-S cluster assembly protein SufD